MPDISGGAAAVTPSGIREIAHLAMQRGEGIARLEIGEPDFPTPSHIVEAAVQSARAGSGYTSSMGTEALRAAFAAKMHRLYGLDVPLSQVIVSHGGMQGCAAAVAALLDPGGEVLLPDPGYPNHAMLVTLFRGRATHYPLRPENGFVPDPEEISRLVSDATQLILINSPSNPTGAVIPEDVVEEIIDMARRYDITVLSDEVYDEIVFGMVPKTALQHDTNPVVSVFSLSKTYAMTGWRVGFIAAPSWLAERLAVLQEPLITCLSSVTQAAGLAALEGPQDCVFKMRDTYEQRRDIALSLTEAMGLDVVPPQGSFYMMLPLESGSDSREAALQLLDHGVSVSPGSAFGKRSASQLRISLATNEQVLREGMRRIAGWIEARGRGKT